MKFRSEYGATVKANGRSNTDHFSEIESDETDRSRERENDVDESHSL